MEGTKNELRFENVLGTASALLFIFVILLGNDLKMSWSKCSIRRGSTTVMRSSIIHLPSRWATGSRNPLICELKFDADETETPAPAPLMIGRKRLTSFARKMKSDTHVQSWPREFALG